MKTVNPFRGLGVALVTPFTPDGSVDVESLEALIDFQIAGGVDFLCVLGTTAETPCLTEKEKRLVMSTAVKVNAGRVPLLLGAGGNCTAEVIRSLQEIQSTGELEGFAGVLSVCPYYNKPSQRGLYEHFKAISEESPLPVVLYNVPSRTGVNLDAETTLSLACDCERIVAIKEASGRIEQICKILEKKPKNFDILSGDDGLTLELIKHGAVGSISVVGNAMPQETATLVHSALNGDFVEAETLNEKFKELYSLLSRDGNPSGIKCLLAEKGKTYNMVRLPLVTVTGSTREALKRFRNGFEE